jgi:hypothetical protein
VLLGYGTMAQRSRARETAPLITPDLEGLHRLLDIETNRSGRYRNHEVEGDVRKQNDY